MWSSTSKSVSLAILSGGNSSRFGTDKGLFAPLGDEPLIVRNIRLFEDYFSEILVVCKDEEQKGLYEAALERHFGDTLKGVRVVIDHRVESAHGPSALLGITTALAKSGYEQIVVLPVDQVGVRYVHLRHLLKRASGELPAAFHCGNEMADLPFPSVWHKTHLEKLLAFVQAGSLSVRGACLELGGLSIPGENFTAELAVNTNTQTDLRNYFGAELLDGFSRRMHYLRFSLTEACNMSCEYCLPDGFPEWYRHKARIGKQEIATILKGFRRLGFRKVRFTGGEPTVHPECLYAVQAARENGFEQIALTTNGLLIKDLEPWLEAGLTHLNISLDSIRPETFQRITKSAHLERVLRLIDEAVTLGIDTKINTVLLRTQNGQEIDELIQWGLSKPLTLRFIELMPTKLNKSFHDAERVFGYEVEERLKQFGIFKQKLPHESVGRNTRGPATLFTHADYPGKIGLINPLSCNFCNSCNRLRVTSRGALRLCLFSEADIPLHLDEPSTLEAQLRQLIETKRERHELDHGRLGNVATFRTIGG